MGREGRAQRGLCSALAAPHGEEGCLRCVLHLQEHGAGTKLSGDRAEVSHQRSQSPHLGPPEEPLHAQLLLHPRRSMIMRVATLYVKAKAETTWRFWGLYVHVCKTETLSEAYE